MKEGDYLEIRTKDNEILYGILMPSSDKTIISLKLDSGYNIGIKRNKVLNIKIKEAHTQKQEKEIKQETKTNSKLKTITILHTGGTVASKVDYRTGAVKPSFSPEDLINKFPELKEIANIKSRLVGNYFSEDIRFHHYNTMAKEIEIELKECDGIILTHGTDTLAHTACALSFALENLNKPVILVGAQRSSDRPSSDAAMNIISAANFIIKTEYNEVAICMHGNSSDEYCDILPALKTKKLHSSRRDAFKTINANSIAKVNKKGEVEFITEYKNKQHKEKLKLKLFNEKLKIGIITAHPNMTREEIKIFSKFDGIVLNGTGIAGNFPINQIDSKSKENELLYKELKKLAKKIPCVMVSQCVFGGINMNVYSTGRRLQEAGILGNLTDYILESAFIKLAWLLSNYKKKEISELWNKNLRGEISNRLEYQKEFI